MIADRTRFLPKPAAPAPVSGNVVVLEVVVDEQQFQLHADEALAALDKAVGALADNHDLEIDFASGALTVEFEEPPGRFVFSPNGPVRQIWISAHSTSYKLGWDSGRAAFVLSATGQTLIELAAELISKQLGEDVTL